MKIKNTTVFLVALMSLVACKEDAKKSEKDMHNIQEKTVKDQVESSKKTYAEISIKEGGKWEGHEYKGGTFKNVEQLNLPSSHTDHSYYIRYEGPGWENSQVGYRLYLDWRNAIDIFGKKTDSIVLPKVGQDGFDSYHHDAPWGQDILKAGKALGIGGYGRYMNDTVAHFNTVEKTSARIKNTAKKSSVVIDYKAWETGEETVNLTSTLSIFPEDRFTKVTLNTSKPLPGLCTGIVKFSDIPLQQKESTDGKWGYLATYGKQTLAGKNDKLGMAIFYKTSTVKETVEGPHDHLVVFNVAEEPVSYYFLAAWEQEPNGITSEKSFINDINEKLNTLEEQGRLE